MPHRNTACAKPKHWKNRRRFTRIYFDLPECVKPSVIIWHSGRSSNVADQYCGRSSNVISKAKKNTLLKELLFYRKNREYLSLFYQKLAQINSGNVFEIIMGDFNIDAFRTPESHRYIMLMSK